MIKKVDKDKETLILELYKKNYKIIEIAKIIDINRQTVRKWLNKNEIKTINRKYKLNEDYFNEINEKKKAYWIGWLWADGNIYKGTLTLNLQTRDKYILEEFRKDIQSNHPITKQKSKIKDKVYFCNVFRLHSIKVIDDLNKINLVKCKGKTTNVPKIPSEFIPSFIQGEFEGDGCLCLNKNETNGKIMIYDTKEICLFIQEFLSVKFNRDFGSVRKKPNANIYEFSFSKFRDILDFYNLIYKDTVFFLNRKKNKFDKLIKNVFLEKSKKTSKYRGVYYLPHCKSFEGCFQHTENKIKTKFRKLFKSEIEAAKFYDEMAKKVLGKNAITNF